jgi:hypothetical protein
MNNIVMRKIVVTAVYQPLSAKDVEVVSVEVSTPPGNSGPVNFKGDDGADVPWIAGEFHSFQRVNLADLKVKGTPGDIVTVVGGSW